MFFFLFNDSMNHYPFPPKLKMANVPLLFFYFEVSFLFFFLIFLVMFWFNNEMQ